MNNYRNNNVLKRREKTIEKPLKPDVRKNEITFFGKKWRYEEEYFQTPMTSYLEFSMKIYLIESNQ